MTLSPNLSLPLLMAAQSQKHVTVNEALSLLDGVCQLSITEIGVDVPPPAPLPGQVWAVGPAPTGEWTGQGGRLALAVNGGWLFVAPQAGWRAWVASTGCLAVHDGNEWQPGAVAVSAGGAATVAEVVETDHAVSAGTTSDTAPLIPAGSVVTAVTARVLSEITGSAASWRLGVAGSEDRYGTGYGLGAGSWARGLTGTPLAYYADTPLRLSAEGGSFAGGTVRIAVHLSRFTLPRG